MPMSRLSAMILLFLVIDPLGNIPMFLCYLGNIEPHRQRRIILRELGFGLGVLIGFLFLGHYLLAILNISQSSLGIAGGIILFLIALKMIFSGAETIFVHDDTGEPFVVPLAIPLIAGPSSMSTVMLLMARDPTRWREWVLALLCAWGVSVAILECAAPLSRVLGPRGLKAIERLMGLILTTVAVEMFMEGLHQSFLAHP